jgi:hypothetical protein
MAREPDSPTLKHEALLALEQSRASLSGGWARAREEWSPRQLLHKGMEKHPAALVGIAAAAALLGFIAVRWMFTGRENSRDTFSKPARKRTLGGIVLNALWGMGREPLKALAAEQLVPVIAKFLSEFKSHPNPPPSE